MAKRQQVQTFESAREAYAKSDNAAGVGGISLSSGAEGAKASIVTQNDNNQSFLDQYAYRSNKITQDKGNAQIFGEIGQGIDQFDAALKSAASAGAGG